MKSGFIAILGKPNVGKSTLLNTLVGEKISIVSWRPQTTRNKVTGIMHGEDYQAIFIDTPGIHSGKSLLCKYMADSVSSATTDVDVALYVVDGEKNIDGDDLDMIKGLAARKLPTVVIVNKMDVADRDKVMQSISKLNDIAGIEVVPVSAAKKENIDVLTKLIVSYLKEGVAYYPEDMVTDKSMRFMAAEIIREKALKFIQQEIPHGIGVEIKKYDVGDDEIVRIEADLICEKNSHKPIIIGHKGDMLKKISIAARKEIEELTQCQVFIRLWVRIKEGWQDNSGILSALGYDKKDI